MANAPTPSSSPFASMTGFGRGSAEADALSVSVEMKSVNLRGLEVKVRLPRAFGHHELPLIKTVKSALERGRVDIAVDVVGAGAGAGLQVNRERLAQVLAEVLRLQKANPELSAPVAATDVLRFPGVLSEDLVISDTAAVDVAIEAAAQMALERLVAARLQEGAGLAADLRHRRSAIASLVDEIESRMAASTAERRAKLSLRLAELLGEALDPQRLVAETATLAERLDVSEEMARLRLHLEQLDTLVERRGSGRRIDFLCQELLREANTTASKCQDAAVAHLVVELKAEIERLREQAQNVE